MDLTLKQFEKLAKRGDAGAQFSLGHIYFEEKDYEKAIYWYTKLVENELYGKDADVTKYVNASYYYISASYWMSNNLHNYEKAAYWCRKGIEVGDYTCMSMMGELYKHGDGVEKSYEKAIYWHKKAAEKIAAEGDNESYIEEELKDIEHIKKLYYNGYFD